MVAKIYHYFFQRQSRKQEKNNMKNKRMKVDFAKLLIFSGVDSSGLQAYCYQPKHNILCFSRLITTIYCVNTINYNAQKQ